ncbi:hypothetical protein [Pseudonocardia sp. WMMC193]|uniref:hypothetical protein n=1 Tax=Pseudonocardia sp. WMMC193 TaxID=2911965 RepID=UPI001F3743B8|nr:hypothetical protein [Pseudonocardia sp. WMMC193]MCF7551344.1 hypothetical protein [Pseudonocardia sp. WMMC193]
MTGWVIGLALVAFLATGCAVQTGEFLKTRDSNYGQVGDLQLLHVHLATPPREGWQPGARVPLHLTLVNRGADRVTVTGVSSTGAAAVSLVGADGAQDRVAIALDPGETRSMQEQDASRFEVDGLAARLTAGTTLPVAFRLDTGEEIVLAVPAQVSSDPVVRSR